MQYRDRVRWLIRVSAAAVFVSLLSLSAAGQSTDQQYPTPVRTNDISGTIRARDIGDSRLTSYYYTFEGGQGDIFINVQTRSFTGDIDVYVLNGLQPLTKIVIYADLPETETGRVIYLRKPERLLLRIQGRTPGDDDASFRIKFAGSFAASTLDDSLRPELPKIDPNTTGEVRVNSVGTIIPSPPKPIPTPVAEADRTKETEAAKEKAAEDVPPGDEKVSVETPEKEVRSVTPDAPVRQEVVITDPIIESKAKAAPPPAKTARERTRRSRATPPKRTATRTDRPMKPAEKAAAEKAEEPDPLAGVRLVISFKDGGVIERPMNEILRFSVERAILTVISKNGTIGRYKMTDVAKVSIE